MDLIWRRSRLNKRKSLLFQLFQLKKAIILSQMYGTRERTSKRKNKKGDVYVGKQLNNLISWPQ